MDIFILGSVSREMPHMCPLVQVPVTQSAKVIMPFVLAGRGRDELAGVQYLFGKPEYRYPFLLLFSKH